MPFRTLKGLDHTEGTVQLVESEYNLGYLSPATHYIIMNSVKSAPDMQTVEMHNSISHLKGTSVVLIPQPSDDPDDPLRWPQWMKYMAFINVCAFSFMTNVSIGGLSPAFYVLSLEFDRSITVAAGLLTWCILALGLGVSTIFD